MARDPYRRRATVPLEEPVFDAFAQFAATAYPNQPLVATIREACLAFMGTDPLDAARIAARRAAWLVARREIAMILVPAMKRAAQAFEQEFETAGVELASLGVNSNTGKAA